MKINVVLNLIIIISLTSLVSRAQTVQKLSVNEFSQKLSDEKEYQLVDVRTTAEYKEGHIKDALNIDYNSADFQTLIGQLDKTKPTYVYCLAGGRSASAAKVLEEQGFKTVYDLDGGMRKWKEEKKPFETLGSKSSGMSKKDFDHLIQSEKMVLIDFGAKWCGPCKKMSPTIEKLSKEKELKTKIVTIDVDDNEQLSQTLNIEALPTLQLYKNNKLVWEQVGYLGENELRDAIKKYKD